MGISEGARGNTEAASGVLTVSPWIDTSREKDGISGPWIVEMAKLVGGNGGGGAGEDTGGVSLIATSLAF